MKKIILPRLFFAAVLLTSFVHGANAQDYAATKEKIYIHTNHVFFKPGEVLYFKLYLVKGEDQTPSRISNVVYTELISPAGTVVQKSNFAVQDGYAEGSFDFTEQAVGGIYKIKAYTTWMQNESESSYFIKEVTLQKALAPRILMKLDFPEKGYGAGDEVKANFSMRNISDAPIRNYDGKYTVSIGGEVTVTKTFTTDAEGKAVIIFSLPEKLSVTDGLLNITIEYDAFTESISRSIPIVLNRIDLQFMPEGGSLVNGISSYVAFKALNENGKAADIKGEVRDNNGNKVAEFSSYHFGMGKFLLTPAAGQSYKAVITSPSNIKQQFELPAAFADGIIMHISKENKKITVTLHAVFTRDVKLKAISRNTTYYLLNLALHKGENSVILDENIFPAGIAQFTLYAANEMPLAERLVFMNEDQRLQVSVTPDKQKYLPREKVMLTIKTLDETGKPIPSNFSLAVVDDKLWTFADDKQDHILSWLLLTSELKGKVEEPQFYFKKEEPKSVPALDLLMLTHGYRYFDYIEYVVKEGALKYMPDQDNILSGQILNDDKQPLQAKIFLINTRSGGKAMEITTGEDGVFFFSDLLPANSYYLFAQAVDKKQKVNINVLQNGLGYNPMKAMELKMAVGKPAWREMIVSAAPAPKVVSVLAPLPGLVKGRIIQGFEIDQKSAAGALQEVVVIGYGTVLRRDMVGSIARISADDIVNAANLQNLLAGKVAGLQVNQNANFFAESKINIRGLRSITGDNQPLFVVNGIPVEQLSLNTINPGDIDNITVVKDATATALYGSRAANGAIIITSKKFRQERIQFNLANKYYYASQIVYTAGTVFAAARKFYVPRYVTTVTDERTDFRETIYWNPVVQTDKNGTASVEFYNSDASTTFRAVAEGIGHNGKLGRTESTYAVRNALQVDAKIPPYLTAGDKALLPLIIKNNSRVAEELSLQVIVPDGFKTGHYPATVIIPADSSVRVLVPVEATRAVDGNIRFIISGQSGKETISLPIQATEKGFSVKLVYSGNQPAQHDFTIDKMIPGSLTAKLKLFNTLEGQLLDGIESMLREPNGCFEQTSSTTYPNIFVLKYLKESGKSNPDIEKKALDYIQKGYKRLIGFETKENGFEWFGNTPPHEALSAYGLLEFTDMKEYVDVDKNMLERTKKFLLGRRDGKGSFNVINKGYDQFASVPNKIANSYIVYALTQAGIGKEIQKEYETAVQKAIESKDGYQLAMMSIAAHNMKDFTSYKKLIDLLDQQKDNLKAETSVVNSRDASLRVETNALYAIALMKAPSPDIAKAAGLISKILGEKSYYGYGSTQATVMALQAIVEYSKLAGRVAEDAPVSFLLNNAAVTDKNILEQLNEGNNNFSISYPQKDKAIPYNMEISYSTFTPPNSDKAELLINTGLKTKETKVGETVRMDITITNTKAILQPMAIAKVGIPAGLSTQPWQLKEIMEKNKAAYYEIFDNYLVFYWMGFSPNESKTISLDLKAEVPGIYKGKASTVYLYYTPEYKNWKDGVEVTVN